MSTKFFTNKADNTLFRKIEGIFTHTQVHYFDALVGYFRSSGYFRIRKYIAKASKIRILVGINVDSLCADSANKGLEFFANQEQTIQEFINILREDIQCADYSKYVEEGILQFIEDVATKKIEIRAHPDKNLHAKIYIFRQETEHQHAGYGAVITGSSNLTEAGLERNFEFNVELRDYDDIKFALATFDELWNESTNILPIDCNKLKAETYLNDESTPFEIYIKLLTEYFGKSIEYDPEAITDLPKGYKKLAYQMDAVVDGYNKLIQHNGFFLADVVGLGKTVIAIMIAKKFYFSNGYRTKILIIHPPALEKAWKEAVRDFELPNTEFITNGSLHKIKHPEDYDLLIVDEAHKFRSDESEMFHNLQKLCKTTRKRAGLDGSLHKKIMLVSATPLNNRPEDIRNLLYLFQDAKLSTLEIGNIQHFFRPLIDRYRKLRHEKDKALIRQEVKKIYDEIRNKILDPVIVRRTRTDISSTPEYSKDMIEQGLSFPKIEKPNQILYKLGTELNKLYDETLLFLKDTKNGIGYFRYQAIKYLNEEAKKKYTQADLISEQLAEIMRILLVKRMESSFYAFTKSLERFYNANKAMISMFENDRIYIAPKLNVNEYILEEREEMLLRILEDTADPALIQCYKGEDFSKEFIDGLKKDYAILEKLLPAWKSITIDPKFEALIPMLENELFKPTINDNHKLIIFTESSETAEYLAVSLKTRGISSLLMVTSNNISELADKVRRNFDARIAAAEQENEVDILITTEVLAEGINLHRSNVLLNYDIPWNSTKLMQRIGRVNRIGTLASKIHIYHFIPTVEADSEIELNQKAFIKLQAFHSALGEDSQIYTHEEEFGSFGLFEKLPEEEKDERLEYLSFLRQFKEENQDWFRKIAYKMPRRSRVGRKEKTRNQHTVTYIKDNKRDSFYYIYPDGRKEELSFIEAVKIFKANTSERSTNLHELHHEQIQSALNDFRLDVCNDAVAPRATIKLGPNEQRSVAFIASMSKQDFVSDNERILLEKANDSIKAGRFQKLPREIQRLLKESEKKSEAVSTVYEKLLGILNQYPFGSESSGMNSNDECLPEIKLRQSPEIIISESFTNC